jgi:predicted small lipoprotein YifL
MKKFKSIKIIALLITVFAFSNCEENGPIQFAVVDEVTATVDITDIEGKSEIDAKGEQIDLSDLLSGASNFVSADVESVTLTLENYTGSPIVGNLNLMVDGKSLFSDQSITLSSTTSSPIPVLEANRDILSAINSGEISYNLNATTEEPIEVNAVRIIVAFTIKATVE